MQPYILVFIPFFVIDDDVRLILSRIYIYLINNSYMCVRAHANSPLHACNTHRKYARRSDTQCDYVAQRFRIDCLCVCV